MASNSASSEPVANATSKSPRCLLSSKDFCKSLERGKREAQDWTCAEEKD